MVPQVNQQVIALQIKVHDVLRVKILHPERGVHRYDEPLPKIRAPFQIIQEIAD
jgi:hypothetical protein